MSERLGPVTVATGEKRYPNLAKIVPAGTPIRIPAILGALEAVLEIHESTGDPDHACQDCGWQWPCPTYEAITDALTGEGES